MNYPYQLKTFEDYQEAYKQSVENPTAFWANIAENFTWKRKWDTVLDWNFKERIFTIALDWERLHSFH